MPKRKSTALNRRDFLRSAAAGTAVLVSTPAAPAKQPLPNPRSGPPSMSPAAEVEMPSGAEVLTADRTGSDFMVDVIKSLGFEYVCANPGSSFRGLHESMINYGGNKSPEFITCCHEESSVAMAHGYAKIEGKPLLSVRARHGGIAARRDGDLQRVLRPRAGLYYWREHHRCDQARPAGGMGAQRAGRGGDACAITRSGTICRFRCRISRSRRCALTKLR